MLNKWPVWKLSGGLECMKMVWVIILDKVSSEQNELRTWT